MPRTPVEILESFTISQLVGSTVDPLDVVGEIVEDVIDSMTLALRTAGVDEAVVADAATVARDYFGNHYS
jgi:hypothetical protein